MVKRLLKADYVDIHSQCFNCLSPFECAAYMDDVEMMKLLLSRADMNLEAATNALTDAVASATLEAVQLLMALNVDLNTTRKGATLLCLAAQCGCTTIQDVFLEDEPVEFNCMNPSGHEPLILTLIRSTHYTEFDRLTRLLDLHERVNLNAIDAQGNTALHFMTEKGHLLGWIFLEQN